MLYLQLVPLLQSGRKIIIPIMLLLRETTIYYNLDLYFCLILECSDITNNRSKGVRNTSREAVTIKLTVDEYTRI